MSAQPGPFQPHQGVQRMTDIFCYSIFPGLPQCIDHLGCRWTRAAVRQRLEVSCRVVRLALWSAASDPDLAVATQVPAVQTQVHQYPGHRERRQHVAACYRHQLLELVRGRVYLPVCDPQEAFWYVFLPLASYGGRSDARVYSMVVQVQLRAVCGIGFGNHHLDILHFLRLAAPEGNHSTAVVGKFSA